MKIHFRISYKTQWGQQLFVSGNIPELGNGDFKKALRLNYSDNNHWEGETEIQPTTTKVICYRYILFDENTNIFSEEWGECRKISNIVKSNEHLFCIDLWNPTNAVENIFLSSPFRNVLLKDEHPTGKDEIPENSSHIFKVQAPLLQKHESVCIIGNCEELGNWSVNKPKLLQYNEDNFWTCGLNLKKLQKTEISYKYGIYNTEKGVFSYFEEGSDRFVQIFNSSKVKIIKNDGFVRMKSNQWHGAGVGLPVFSIRTKKSFGTGDFVDLKLLVDWAKLTGLKLIQVLPLNDTTGTHTDADVLPYAAISAFALNPLFLNLPALGKLPADHTLQQEYNELQPKLNALERVEFLEVINFKYRYAKELYLINKNKFLKNKDFRKFFKKNEYWLVPYAAYCVLRDKFGTSDYRQWNEFSKFDKNKINQITSNDSEFFDEVATNYFIQYHLHCQLSEAATYAHENGIILKGDIPIGVNRNSVDTWVSPQLFNMHKQAGAPPDMFAIKGQNWELPTYNWETIKQTGFEWWKNRLNQMSEYFDTFRIDHILGFFRIWEIPLNQVEGIMGNLNPSIPVHINEFAEKGIWFDYNRFCKPYVTDSLLWDLFGEESHWVKANCLKIDDGWILRLKNPYLSQVYVDQLFNEGKISERIRNGLFDLISNVLFFEVEGNNQTLFYPRFGMENIRSFQDLDETTRHKLREIYVDYFYRRQDAFWYRSGMEKLPVLKRSTNMLICGEDLGMMTHCVTTVMKELGILSLEVQRAPKTNTIEFAHPNDAPYLSVVTPSTHDMSTIRGWWEEDRAITQRFYNSQLGHYGEAPFFCESWICRDILLQHLYSPAMWAIFQFQDLLSISDKIRRENPHDERINVPSNSKYSWRYRMHISLEDLIQNKEFNNELRNYINQSGR